MLENLKILAQELEQINDYQIFGRVAAVKGLIIELTGLTNFAAIGSRVKIITRNNHLLYAEIIGFNGNISVSMAFADVTDVGVGCIAELMALETAIRPDDSWRGRVLNAFAEPIDEHGPLLKGASSYPLKEKPPIASKRKRVAAKIDLGVKVLDIFTAICGGQRMGVFAGSGVGKSVMISMLTKFSAHQTKVIGLIGERGREVQEFIEDYLGEEGLKQAVVVVATSDEPPLARRQAAFTTMAIAEYFRNQGQEVLCIMDSVTRFAMAQREIGLAIGEPPATKGYTPSVFSELARLLERAGPGEQHQGAITGLFSVLVEGDDLNEPICDTVRGIVDGHIVLSRAIAERGRYPAVDVLKSISRMMPGCNSEQENNLIQLAKSNIALYEDMADMIKLGAYKPGNNQEVDQAIKYYQLIEEFIKQRPGEQISMQDSYQQLADIFKI